MSDCYQMLRECVDEWQWCGDTWETQTMYFRVETFHSVCLKERCWTRVPRLQEWPEAPAETPNASLLRLRILEPFRPTALWPHGFRPGCHMYGLVSNDEFQIAIYYCWFPHMASGLLVKVWFFITFVLPQVRLNFTYESMFLLLKIGQHYVTSYCGILSSCLN